MQKIIGCVALSLCIIGASKVVKAWDGTYNAVYSYTLPVTGSCLTWGVPKTHDTWYGTNRVDHISNNKDCNFWLEENGTGVKITQRASFSGTGNKYTYWGWGSDQYIGKKLQMRIKTAANNWVATKIDGVWTPN